MPLIAGLAILVACSTAACGIPRDPEGTLDRIRGGTMRVGVTEHEPWVVLGDGGEPEGVEVSLVERLAEELDAEIQWVPGSEEEVMSALELRDLDLVVGGFGADALWASVVTLSHPYLTTRLVVGVPEEEPFPESLNGLEVAAEEGTQAPGLLKEQGAVPVLVETLDDIDGPAAVDDWLLDDVQLQDAGFVLEETKHAFALPAGENAWIVEVERFLLARRDQAWQLLQGGG